MNQSHINGGRCYGVRLDSCKQIVSLIHEVKACIWTELGLVEVEAKVGSQGILSFHKRIFSKLVRYSDLRDENQSWDLKTALLYLIQ